MAMRRLVLGGLAMGLLLPGLVGLCGEQSSPAPGLSLDNALNVSWGDHIVVSKGAARLDSPEHIRESLSMWRDLGGAKAVYWRISSWAIDR